MTQIEHCSYYLANYVLSEAVELKLEVNFLSGKFPFVLEPNSELIKIWHNFALCVITISSVLFPYYIFFKRGMSPIVVQLSVFNDIINYLDIFIQCSTAIKIRGVIIANWSAICKYRMQQFSFLIDMIATFPANYLQLVVTLDCAGCRKVDTCDND